MSYVVMWEFHVRPGAEVEFERVYGPEGDWVRLFRQGAGYVRSDLLRDREEKDRYVVLDHWVSRDQYDAFRAAHATAYGNLDRRCESLTSRETHIGSFTVVE
ncbi:MAG: antibiotic biosynthesis monooxygenase [Acidobacteriia bacterium]|nr:antibiotic biosynthesis monooxygenase [Terriglobia bacterium]